MIKGFLLDVDGTLVNSNDAHASSWIDAFAKFGYNVSFAEVRPLIGMGSDHLLPVLFPKLNKDNGIGKEITELRSKILNDKYLPGLLPTNGARELITELQKRKLKLVIATSSQENELRELLKKAKVEDLLTTFTTASDVRKAKPSPDIVSSALKKINLKPEEIYMLGDTPYDIQAARKCGVKTIALRSGSFSDELLNEAIFIFDDPLQLKENLSQVLPAS